MIALELLQDAPRNANKMEPGKYQALKLSIQKKGFLQPVLVVRLKGAVERYRIVDGHHRIKALRELGEVYADAIVADLTPEDIEALGLGMNRARGELDLSISSDILISLGDVGWTPDDLLITGFSAGELEDLMHLEASIQDLVEGLEKEKPEKKQKTSWHLKIPFKSRETRDAVEYSLQKHSIEGEVLGDTLLRLLDRASGKAPHA